MSRHVLGEVVGQGALHADHVLELLQLAVGRQVAAHQQIADLLEAETVVFFQTVDKVIDVVAAIGQAALDGFAFALVQDVAVNVAEVGRTDQNAGAVRITQAALDAVAGEQVGRDLVMQTEALAQLLQLLFFYKIRLNIHPAFPFLFRLRLVKRPAAAPG